MSPDGRAGADAGVPGIVGGQSCDAIRAWDLAQPMHEGMPAHPRQPVRFTLSLVRRHGDSLRKGGYSAANELILMCGHHGTHIDAPGHVSVGGYLHGQLPVAEVQRSSGLDRLDIAGQRPVVARGVLVDIPRLRGVPRLDSDAAISVAEVEEFLTGRGVTPRPGDVYLFRTGWGSLWGSPSRYYPADDCDQPGPDIGVATWLTRHQAGAAGSDTIAFEHYVHGRNTMPCHEELLFNAGINIVENLNLEQLSADDVTEFWIVLAPLPLRGATGSPVRPIALVPPAGQASSTAFAPLGRVGPIVQWGGAQNT